MPQINDDLQILRFAPRHRDAVISLAIDAWTPVFDRTRTEVPRFVYDAFYPKGWAARQRADVAALLDDAPETIAVACVNGVVVGFVGVRMHPEDSMGEIEILAVAPDRQRTGVGGRLIAFAEDAIRSAGMTMAMVETVGDSGHLPARRAYEAVGFEPWPVARYFKRV